MERITITITIEVPDGNGHPVIRVEGIEGTTPSTPGRQPDPADRTIEGARAYIEALEAAAPPAPSSRPAVQPRADPARAEALRELARLGVEDPQRLLDTYNPARILAVCRSARRRAGRVKNLAGWVVMALHRGWQVDRPAG